MNEATDRLAPQNVYDDPEFFAGYSGLERYGQPFGAAYEHPSFVSLLPEIAGARALDLGCGAGHLALFLAEGGAAEVIGLDASERMLEDARRLCPHPRVEYLRNAMESVEFPYERFELVVSSLALHYVADYGSLLRRIAHWLTPDGHVVLSMEHPIVLTRASPDGWARDTEGAPRHWTIDDYGIEGPRDEHWFRDGVRKYHRTLATLINGVIDAGLTVERVLEPAPSDEQLVEHPDWQHERRRPPFLLVRASKPAPMVS